MRVPLVSIAPMMDWTDRHYRYFMRLMTKKTSLYTEMVTTGALIYNEPARFLQYHSMEHPVVLQLGGSTPKDLQIAAQLGEAAGYDEINLNVGCPSDRVQSGRFGACLMAEPELVAECVAAMRAVVKIPVTVKCRIGIDEQDQYADLQEFVKRVADAGCEHFIIHARKAWLKGLSPKQNREVPPLNYERVYQVKQEFPELKISINGGIKTIADIQEHLRYTDGVMIGREAYYNPYLFAAMDQLFFDEVEPPKTRRAILQEYMPYLQEQVAMGVPIMHMVRHVLGLFHGISQAREWRRLLSVDIRQHPRPFELLNAVIADIA
jgi:tRNA-dihydrouridine synthase A